MLAERCSSVIASVKQTKFLCMAPAIFAIPDLPESFNGKSLWARGGCAAVSVCGSLFPPFSFWLGTKVVCEYDVV